jgi:hypothetical protein
MSSINKNYYFSFPNQNWNADNYQNQGNRSIILAMKPETSLFHAVEQLAYILEKDPTKTLIKVAYDNDLIEKALMNSCIKERVSLIQFQRWAGCV